MRPENIRRLHREQEKKASESPMPSPAATPPPAPERAVQGRFVSHGAFEQEAAETVRRTQLDVPQGRTAVAVPVAVAADGSYQLSAEQAAALGLRPATGSGGG